jgi:hypothetical protein
MSDQPVAWGMPQPDGLILDVICPEEHARCEGSYTVPLYAAPQPRERLTDEEITEGCRSLGVGSYQSLAAAFKAGVRYAEDAIWSKT